MSIEIREMNMEEIFSTVRQNTLQSNQSTHLVNQFIATGDMGKALQSLPQEVRVIQDGGLIVKPISGGRHLGNYIKKNWPALCVAFVLGAISSLTICRIMKKHQEQLMAKLNVQNSS